MKNLPLRKTTLFTILSVFLLLSSCSEGVGTYGTDLQGDTSGDGQNGSYTALIAVSERLYYVDFNTLYTSDISDPNNVKVIDQQIVGEDVETLYYRNGILFIGSGPALLIYALDAEGIPLRISETRYTDFDEVFVPCDPVIADDDFAYATLSSVPLLFSANNCARPNPINQLRIYSLQNITDPSLVSALELVNPKGLALDGDILFVCDSEAGLKVIDVTDRNNPETIQEFTDIETYDVIARDGLLIVTGPSAIVEYDYSDIKDIKRLSIIDL